MTWFKVDDSFYDHPKVFDAPDCAVALWMRAGCWSARNLTDGFVPSKMPARLCDDPDTAVGELLRRGLWKRTRDGFLFHDWHEYQPTKESVEALREKRAEAGRRGGQAKAAKQNGSNGLANASEVAKQNSAPARPDPTLGGHSLTLAYDRAREAPPPRCEEHLEHPDPPPCGRCADARKTRNRWEAERNQRSRDLPHCPRHRGEPAHNCGRCRSEALAGDA